MPPIIERLISWMKEASKFSFSVPCMDAVQRVLALDSSWKPELELLQLS
jgi:hypothetical protein